MVKTSVEVIGEVRVVWCVRVQDWNRNGYTMEHEQERTGDEMVGCVVVVIGRGDITEETEQSRRPRIGAQRPGLKSPFFFEEKLLQSFGGWRWKGTRRVEIVNERKE